MFAGRQISLRHRRRVAIRKYEMTDKQLEGKAPSHAGGRQLSLSSFTTSAEPVLMSSVDIAALTGKRHSDVIRDIRSTLKQAGITERNFASSYKDDSGKENVCYTLPRFECDLVVSGYSVKCRAAIIRRWHELENSARQSSPPAVAAWFVAKAMQFMPAEQLLQLLTVPHPYGSLAPNGKRRTGWRRPCYVAARHREEAATAFQEGMLQLNLTLQLELPKLAQAIAAMGGEGA
ncbi:MAG: anti-repressor protein [Verrucomicrobiales bacterium]|nr:anti-repressor protein [Verrucomicrobiales bacterium]